MKKTLFLFGLAILFFSSLVWVSSSGSSLFQMSGAEFLTILVISIIMMASEVVNQVRKFFNSGRNDIPF